MGKGKLVETSFPFPIPLPFQKLWVGVWEKRNCKGKRYKNY